MNKVLLTLALTLFLAGCDFENPGGVLASNQIPASVLDFVDEENILDDEYIIAYFDATIVLDNSESAILTNKNIIYYKKGRVSKIPLNEITDIDHDTNFGVNIYITPINGPMMAISIPPWNGGDLFLDLLERN